MGLTFGYDLIDSDETRAIYEKMLEDDRVKFLAGRNLDFPLEVAFSLWWFAKGPTAFASGEDAVRYKRELLAHIQSKGIV